MADTGVSDADHHDRLYFGGPPTTRDLKQLYEAGFDSLLSLASNKAGATQGKIPLPLAAEAAHAAGWAGMLHHTLAASDFTSKAGVDEIAAFLDFALANTGGPGGNNNNAATGVSPRQPPSSRGTRPSPCHSQRVPPCARHGAAALTQPAALPSLWPQARSTCTTRAPAPTPPWQCSSSAHAGA